MPSCDIAAVLHRQGNTLDWEAFLERARALRICRLVLYSLEKAAEAVDALVPDDVLDRLRAQEHGLAGRVATRILNTPPGSRARNFLLTILAAGGAVARTRYLAAILFPPRACMVERYHVRRPGLVWEKGTLVLKTT